MITIKILIRNKWAMIAIILLTYKMIDMCKNLKDFLKKENNFSEYIVSICKSLKNCNYGNESVVTGQCKTLSKIQLKKCYSTMAETFVHSKKEIESYYCSLRVTNIKLIFFLVSKTEIYSVAVTL